MNKAIVTGASSGIGKAICRQLAANGWLVYGIGRSFNQSDDIAGAKLGAVQRRRFGIVTRRCRPRWRGGQLAASVSVWPDMGRTRRGLSALEYTRLSRRGLAMGWGVV